MKTKRIAVTILLCALGALLVALLPLGSDSAVYHNTLRLHILANSDDPADQALKLTVRDAVLSEASRLLSACTSAEEAETVLRAHTSRLAACADAVLDEQGSSQRATVTLTKEHYPTREYSGFRLPQGNYTSLCIALGEGEGQNWWCVLYPSLCLSSSSRDAEDAFLAAGFSPDQVRVLTETEDRRFVLRFRLLEWLGSLFS